MPNGTVATYTNIYSEIGIAESFKMPIPTGRKFFKKSNVVYDVRGVVEESTSMPSPEDPAKRIPITIKAVDMIVVLTGIFSYFSGLSFFALMNIPAKTKPAERIPDISCM